MAGQPFHGGFVSLLRVIIHKIVAIRHSAIDVLWTCDIIICGLSLIGGRGEIAGMRPLRLFVDLCGGRDGCLRIGLECGKRFGGIRVRVDGEYHPFLALIDETVLNEVHEIVI
jgi:hypothetical protein